MGSSSPVFGGENTEHPPSPAAASRAADNHVLTALGMPRPDCTQRAGRSDTALRGPGTREYVATSATVKRLHSGAHRGPWQNRLFLYSERAARIVEQCCAELTVHSMLEEELLYPAARDVLPKPDLIDEAEVEHQSAEDLILQLQQMQPGEEKFSARFTVLGEYVKHHVKEEETELFPSIERAKLNWQVILDRMLARREELIAEVMPKSLTEDDYERAESAQDKREPAAGPATASSATRDAAREQRASSPGRRA